MKKHRGMRPHDIVILLKIACLPKANWHMKDLAISLEISASEVSESLHRSSIAGLISGNKKILMKQALLEFLEHGLRYVFPQRPGALVRGMPTAHSAPPLKNEIASNECVVWPYAEGNVRGQAIEPLHPMVPLACERDANLYELLALCDALRVGRVREQKLAIQMLRDKIQ